MTCQSPATYDSRSKDCICFGLQDRLIESTDPNAASYLSPTTGSSTTPYKTCLPCQSGYFKGPLNTPQYSCQSCPFEGQFYSNTGSPTCQCNTALYTPSNGQCLLSTDVLPVSTSYSVTNAQQITYNFVETLQGNAITS